MNALKLLIDIGGSHGWQTKEGQKVGRASNSELRRWLNSRVLQINGEPITKWDEEIDFSIMSVVMWPKNEQQRTTLW
jgi:hypothetical protein